MSEENEFEGNEGEGVADLRKRYEAIKKREAEKDARLAQFEAREKQSTIAAVLKAKGLPEKAAALYTGDDVSEDAVGKWVESYADVFGAQAQVTQTSEQIIDPNAQAAQRTSAAASENTEPGFGQLGQVFGDPEDAEKLMRTLPYEELEKRGWVPATGTLHNPAR